MISKNPKTFLHTHDIIYMTIINVGDLVYLYSDRETIKLEIAIWLCQLTTIGAISAKLLETL